MQDNNSSNQQLIDLGWQRMSTLLDKELPQPTRRRWFGAWWFVAAGVFLGLAGLGYTIWQIAQPDALQELPATLTPTEVASGGHTLSSEGEATIEKESNQAITERTDQATSASEVASSSTEIITAKGNASIKEETKRLQVSQASNTSAQGSTQGKNASSSMKTTSESVKAESRIVQTPIESSKPLKTSSSSTITPAPKGVKSHSNEFLEVPLNEIAETEVKHEKNAEQTEFEGVGESMTNSLMSESLSAPSSARSIISVAQLSENNPAPISDRWNALMIPVARPDRDGRFGLDAMVATHLNSDADPFYGIEAGLSTTLISGKRFSVHGGVSYGYYNVDGFGLGIFNAGNSQDTEDFGAGTGNGGGPDTNSYTGFPIYAVQDVLTGDLEYSEAQELTEKFHYIHLPLRVEYRILPRLLVMAGVKASVLLAAPARYRLNDGRFAAPQSTTVSGSKSFLYNYDIIRKIDVAPLVGVSYNIGDRLSLDATYSHGLRHYINSDDAGDRSDYHRSASIGVRYRIL